MPTKITPLPKVGGTAGGGGTAAAGGGGGAGGAKYGNKAKPPKSAQFFSTSRFRKATRGLAEMAAARGKGSRSALIFTTSVSLGLIVLGIVFVYIGDDNYIIDVMVLGGLCLVMGLGSLLIGCLLILRPAYKERQLTKEREAGTAQPTPVQDPESSSYVNPAFLMDDAALTRPITAPESHELYDRNSLRAAHTARGRLAPPTPPPLSVPLQDRPGTTSTTLTTVDHFPDDVFSLDNDAADLTPR